MRFACGIESTTEAAREGAVWAAVKLAKDINARAQEQKLRRVRELEIMRASIQGPGCSTEGRVR
jgi:hypothetical protein